MATNSHGIAIEALVAGDVVKVATLDIVHERIVVRVVDVDGARGGIVDTKSADGRYSRVSGFVLGDEIIGVERMASK